MDLSVFLCVCVFDCAAARGRVVAEGAPSVVYTAVGSSSTDHSDVIPDDAVSTSSKTSRPGSLADKPT